MEHKRFAIRQVSVQAKHVGMGWIITAKVMTVSPDNIGVKWITVIEEVIPPFDVFPGSKEFTKLVLRAVEKAI